MNKAPNRINQEVKDGSSNISVVRADISLFGRNLEIYHIIDPVVFQIMVKQFNNRHPNLQDDGQSKEKIISFINKRLKMRVAFKSKEAFASHFAAQTFKAIQKRAKDHGNKSSN
jgi:hypothetical protein